MLLKSFYRGLFISALLLYIQMGSVFACDLCAAYRSMETKSAHPGFYTSAFEQFTGFGTLLQDGTVVRDPIGQSLDSSIFIGPTFTMTWKDNLSAELGSSFPAVMDNTSLQLVPDYRIRAALTWRF